mgnify:CR=1 FL=1
MKKIFLFLAVSLFALAACENSKTQASLIVSTAPVDMAYYGGSASIIYKFENAQGGEVPTVEADQTWVNNFVVAENITFNVDFNNTAEVRKAVITVSYGAQNFEIEVSQAAGMVADVEFVATALNGEYYGTAYSADPNYFAILSKNGTTGWSDLYVDTYYRFDLYSTSTTDENAPVLPHGVYTFDKSDMGIGGTFGHPRSVRLETFQNGQFKETQIEEGVVIISENKFEALLKLVDGKVHRVIYEGSLELGYIPLPEPDYYSTLTEDYTFNHPEGILRINYYGDYYGVGAANWVVSMVLPGAKVNGDYFSIDLVANTNEYNVSSIFGTYTCAADESQVAKNTFIAGDYQDRKFLYSWYFVCVDDTFGSDDIAPLTDGTITISEVDGKYVVEYDCMDDNGHKIQGTYTCATLEMYNSTQQ